MSGSRIRRSTATKPKPATTDAARQMSVAGDVQPHDGPSLNASTRGTNVAAISNVPAKSTERGRSGSRDSWTVRSVSGTQSAAIAASTQKRACQPTVSTSAPPRSGPRAAPAADAAPQRATARICAAPVAATDSRLSPQASSVEPAAP